MWKLLAASAFQRRMTELTTCFAVTTAILVDPQYPVGTKYNFVYTVNDPLTHDIKNQWETRVGDKVQGSYRLVEADGTVRIVDYYADGKHGFRATVRREGQAYHLVQPYQNIVPVQLVPIPNLPFKRDYYGATFVREKSYGRGLGYL